eukprot:m.107580 g.107580  ORF g.107580 m.107580 type:complete len:318 (-) comp27807_c1_seq3:104-1057(-)
MADFFKVPSELQGVSSEAPKNVALVSGDTLKKEVLQTKFGDLTVHVQPAAQDTYVNIITYHEIGLDSQACWETLFNHPAAKELNEKATIYHITAPGQGAKDPDYQSELGYPSMDQLATQVGDVVNHFKLNRWVGMGAGAGANILLRYAATDQQRCLALCLMSPLVRQASWSEWGFKKVSDMEMSMVHGLPTFVQNQLINTYFSVKTVNENVDLVNVTKKYMETEMNAVNFGWFLQSYVDRTDLTLEITRKNFRVQTLICTGGNTIHTEEVMEALPCFPVDKIDHIEVFHVGDLIHLEQPFEVLRGFKLMLAGLGIIF